MKNKEEETVAEETADASEEKKDTVEELDEDVANMVLDEEMEQAALKIQSTFRGHKTRKVRCLRSYFVKKFQEIIYKICIKSTQEDGS